MLVFGGEVFVLDDEFVVVDCIFNCGGEFFV